MTDSKALYIICMENNIVKMRQALAGGINPNQRLNENGIKALHIVARRGHQEMVSLLLQQPDIEMNPKTQAHGGTPLLLRTGRVRDARYTWMILCSVIYK